MLNLKPRFGPKVCESQSVLNLKPRFGPKVCGEPKRVKLEADSGQRFVEPKRVKLETQIRAKGLWRAKAC